MIENFCKNVFNCSVLLSSGKDFTSDCKFEVNEPKSLFKFEFFSKFNMVSFDFELFWILLKRLFNKVETFKSLF